MLTRLFEALFEDSSYIVCALCMTLKSFDAIPLCSFSLKFLVSDLPKFCFGTYFYVKRGILISKQHLSIDLTICFWWIWVIMTSSFKNSLLCLSLATSVFFIAISLLIFIFPNHPSQSSYYRHNSNPLHILANVWSWPYDLRTLWL